MKQVIQNLRSGVLELLDVPAPKVSPGHLLIQTRASLISAGTERMLVEFGKASLLAKARQNPQRVRQVLDKVKTDGLLPTLQAVFAKLDEPLPLGYCNAGVVLEVGPGVAGWTVGDRVASNAPHCDVVNQPVNLCARIPSEVSDEQAAFTPLAAIALQGVRLVAPQIGETVAVFGLGLVGLLAVQLLVAAGVQVLAIDLDESRRHLAEQFGARSLDAATASQMLAQAASCTGGHGVDAVLIAAAAKNDQILHHSAHMCRKRGRIVLVGSVDLNVDRADFYEKELTFQVSCSYGPGRYDPAYEQQGLDYPLAYVRWTEQRNFEAVLRLMAERRLDVDPLITARVPHGEAQRGYNLLTEDRSQLGIVFQYAPAAAPLERTVPMACGQGRTSPQAAAVADEQVAVGVIGAGSFTTGVLLPALARTPARRIAIASAGGVSATHAARKFGFERATTDYRTILDDPSINTVFITTRHHLHAPMVVDALRAGKHVFVEKPLAIDEAGLDAVRQAHEQAGDRHLLVGFNRRFAPHAEKMRCVLAGRTQPLCINMTINAGHVPPDHWVHDPAIGGGRIVGEACHWIDLARFLAASPIESVRATTVGGVPGVPRFDDCATIVLTMADGSLATIHYFANGHRGYPKERFEVFSDGRVLELNNFWTLRGYGFPGFRRMKLWRQDKGHRAELERFVAAVAAGGPPLIPAGELFEITRCALVAGGPPI
jgi:predicted dehydrogenase/threonine dehydrogenase-like Zn-dependent dehydrogenase